MKRRGLTLFEMVVTLAIFSLALLVLGQLFHSYNGINSGLNNREEPLLQAREAVQAMVAEAQGALAISSPAPNASATTLTFTVVAPGQVRFPLAATSWTPNHGAESVTYQVSGQNLTRTLGSQPPLVLAQRVEGLQLRLELDHRLEVALSIRVGSVLRSLRHNGFYWVKTL